MINNYMIDIETLGTKCNATILQLAAVEMNSRQVFIRDIDVNSCYALGSQDDASAVEWWQSQGGFKPHTSGFTPIVLALHDLANFIPQDAIVWANGVSFDIGILGWYYNNAICMPEPWKFRNVRDLRTVRALAQQRGWVDPTPKAAHNAGEDCLRQIEQLESAANFLGIII